MTTTPEREALAAMYALRDEVWKSARGSEDVDVGQKMRDLEAKIKALAATPPAAAAQAMPLPHGWRIEAIVETPFKSYRIVAPNGYEALVYSHERNPANVLYMLADALASQEGATS